MRTIVLVGVMLGQALPALAKDECALCNVLPDWVSVGRPGHPKPSLMAQTWIAANGGDKPNVGFRLRRLELGLKGDIIRDWVGFNVMVDPAKALEFKNVSLVPSQLAERRGMGPQELVSIRGKDSPLVMLQDLALSVQTPVGEISAGQFKTPMSWEGFNSSSRLLLPERAVSSREFGDKRDLGIRMRKTFEYVGYMVGLFNNAPISARDLDNGKDASARVEFYPFQGALVGAAGSVSLVNPMLKESRVVGEMDARLERGPVLLQSELLMQRRGGSPSTAEYAAGGYGAVGFTFLERLQPVLRLGFLDPDILKNAQPDSKGTHDELVHADAGLNYLVVGNALKAQLMGSGMLYHERPASGQVVGSIQAAF